MAPFMNQKYLTAYQQNKILGSSLKSNDKKPSDTAEGNKRSPMKG